MALKKKPSQAYLGNGFHSWEVVVDSAERNSIHYVAQQPRTMRLRVPGGYLYRVFGSGTTFVPMPSVVKHKV